jgi:tetratricopeptide (TPR) repeat protein
MAAGIFLLSLAGCATPQQRAASLDAADYLRAAARLEKAGQVGAARVAYERVLERWPDNPVALMGLGNTAYATGDLESAEQAFRRATIVQPRSAVAHNNLAQTLADFKEYDEALAEARAAIDLGGALEDASIRTFDAIAVRTGRGEQEWHR